LCLSKVASKVGYKAWLRIFESRVNRIQRLINIFHDEFACKLRSILRCYVNDHPNV